MYLRLRADTPRFCQNLRNPGYGTADSRQILGIALVIRFVIVGMVANRGPGMELVRMIRASPTLSKGRIAAVFPSCCQKLRECVLKDASKVLDWISIEMRYR